MSLDWLSSRVGLTSRKSARTKQKARDRRRRFVLESLEERVVLAFNLSTSVWSPIGPAPILNGQTPGNMPVTGRIAAVAASPTDANTIYIAASNGGVWRTTDGGLDWTPLTDDQASLHMGAIAIAPSNPNIIYAGTGEASAFFGAQRSPYVAPTVFSGQGILRSTDAGNTWTLVGQSVFTRRSISKIVIDPTNANIVYAAVGQPGQDGLLGNQGIWKSIDGGASWRNTTVSISSVEAYTDLVIDPTNPQVLYMAIGQNNLDPLTFAGSGTRNNGIYKTTNGGQTWSRAGNFPGGVSNARTKIAISRSNPRILVASVVDPQNFDLEAMYKTTDGGATWTALQNVPNYLGGQGPYDTALAIDPNNPNRIYAGGQGTYSAGDFSVIVSVDGGLSWSEISGFGRSTGPHPDHHGFDFDANGRLLNVNDGGIWRLDDPTPTAPVWAALNGDLQITTFMGIAMDPTDHQIVYGGSQDNGTAKTNGQLGWTQIRQGDGGFVRVDSGNPNVVYHTYFGNSLERSDDGGQTWRSIAPFQAFFDNSNFYIPYVLDPSNQSRILYGTDHIYQSLNRGQTWTPLARPGRNGFNPIGNAIDNVSVSPVDPNVVWATAAGDIFVTLDGGLTFNRRNITGANDYIPQVFPDLTDARTAYAVRGAYNDRSNRGQVFKTTDGGATWTNITGNLPDVPVYSFEMQVLPSITKLFAGTDVGVFESRDGGTTWSRFKQGMPNAQVLTLELNETLGVLAAGTHGRGAFQISVDDTLVVFPAGNLSGVAGSNDFTNVVVATFADTPALALSEYTAAIDWGDGSTSGGVITFDGTEFTVTGSHVYPTYGNYPMRVTVTSTRGSFDAVSQLASVADAPITGTAQTISIAEGVAVTSAVATFQSGSPSASASNFTATIRWGDNFTTAGTILPLQGGGFEVKSFHAYRQAGTYEAVVTITSRGGSRSTVRSQVTVIDSPITPVAVNGIASESIPFVGTVATYTDASPDGGIVGDWRAMIDWGDMTPPTQGIITQGIGYQVGGTHTYARFGTYQVVVTLTNVLGGISGSPGTVTRTVTSQIVVSDSPISGTASPISASVGTAYTNSVATYVDANPARLVSDLSATIEWEAGSVETAVITALGGGRFSVAGSHVYLSPGDRTVVVRMTSASGTSIPALEVPAAVLDAPLTLGFSGTAVGPADNPTATAPGLTVTLGQNFSGQLVTFTSTDPAAEPSNYSAVVVWGDGTQSAATIVETSPSTFRLDASHLYAIAGAFPLSVRITSPGGRVAVANGTSQVLMPLNGVLDAASDTGASNTDRITSKSTFRYSGTGQFNSRVQLFARSETPGSAPKLVGETVADSLGRWTVDTNSALVDGRYVLSAVTSNVAGQPIQSQEFGASPLVVDTAGPQVLSLQLNAAKAQATIVFADNGSGVIDSGLLSTSSYSLSLPGRRGTTGFAVKSVTQLPELSVDGRQAVLVAFQSRRRLGNGGYVVKIDSNVVADVAGNALFERNFVTFPQLDNKPINTFVAQVDVVNGVASAPRPFVPLPEIIAAQTYTDQVKRGSTTVRIRRRR
ncbi:MAG: Ig-like domain-containing protein [Isosphaeraceae bacterium]|nr:Ig-like domain-containing protein [Isosphaeraceae bacterium]